MSTLPAMNLLAVLTFLCVIFGASAQVPDLDVTGTVDKQWEQFKTTFGKLYPSKEVEELSKSNFLSNLLEITLHNLDPLQNYTKGINAFSDMHSEDVIKQLCGTEVPVKMDSVPGKNFLNVQQSKDTVNWVKEGKVTRVRDQGNCGSCWSFSAAQAIEGQYAMVQNKLMEFSEQQLVDCSNSYGNAGCNGGWPNSAFKYTVDKGIVQEQCYPYTGSSRSTCSIKSSCKKYNVTGSVNVDPSGDETALANAVAKKGPISVAIHVSNNFVRYKEGVFQDKSCKGKSANHAVLVVGYGKDDKGGDYWLVKNSWGESWGESGYIRMARNAGNMCSIASYGSYPTVPAARASPANLLP